MRFRTTPLTLTVMTTTMDITVLRTMTKPKLMPTVTLIQTMILMMMMMMKTTTTALMMVTVVVTLTFLEAVVQFL